MPSHMSGCFDAVCSPLQMHVMRAFCREQCLRAPRLGLRPPSAAALYALGNILNVKEADWCCFERGFPAT
jgi:hypothetical protein